MGITVRYRKDRDKWVVDEKTNGRRFIKSFAGNKQGEKQAREYAAKRESDLNDARFHGDLMGRQPKRTFLEGVERWIEDYDVSSQTKHIAAVIKYVGEGVMIDQSIIDKAQQMDRDYRRQGLSQSTINNRMQVIKRVLNLAFREWGWIETPLGDKIRKRSPKNERHVYLTEGQIGRLIMAVPDSYPIERTIIALAAITGLRRGELLKLESNNVSHGRIILRPDQTKNGKARVVPVPDDAMPWLIDLPFRVTEHTLRTAFEKARKAIGMPQLRFHDLRHSYASMLAQAGENMTTVRDLLGHSSLAVTSRYSHMFDARLDEIRGILPSFSATSCNQTATKQEKEK